MTINTQKLRDQLEFVSRFQANSGHGHVFPRPDGAVARCGGPGICTECSRDQALIGRMKGQHLMSVDEILAAFDAQTAEIARLRDGIEEAIRLLGMDRPINPTATLARALSGETHD